ncbi:MAG: glucosamine-6-phosphate deaminase [Actinomycetota bacterium]|nr:glucosamine-6-phosphate deaminase [Actinomycetota bacterium]
MEVVIVDDPAAGGALAADAVAELVVSRPEAVLGLATGGSPQVVYDVLAARFAAGRLTLAAARAFLLDEYVGLAPGHPASYRQAVGREVVARTALARDRVCAPQVSVPEEELPGACDRYEEEIAAAGGVDLQLLGVGSDGHIGFNEPGSSLGSRTRLKTLTARTRADNARFFGGNLDAVPHHVVTQGVATILAARHLVLLAWGAGKAEAVGRLVEGPVTASVPASALQLHPHATVIVDQAAASRLERRGYYEETWSAKPTWQGI